MDIDWDEDLDLGPASRYPDHLESPVFHWSDDEEDTQRRALGWLLVWRTRNPFILKTNEFTKPVNHVALYRISKGPYCRLGMAREGWPKPRSRPQPNDPAWRDPPCYHTNY